jgi:hypothetical protein
MDPTAVDGHMDQMGEVDYAPGEPKGHPRGTPPRL